MRALSNPLGGFNAEADSINNAGVVVGHANISGAITRFGDTVTHCALWSGTRFTDLGSLGGPSCTAVHINARGQVVGKAWPNDTNVSPVEWQDGHLSVLSTYPGDPDGAALGINNQELIVGGSFTTPGVPVRAVMWHEGRIVDLNGLIPAGTGWHLQLAIRINEVGQIVGDGLINGQFHAFLLTPTRGVDTTLATLPAPTLGSANSPANVPTLPAAARRFMHRWLVGLEARH
jgi:uncharacterized membrane protein